MSISRKTYADGHHALRSVHVKSHALLLATLTIGDNRAALAQGLFAQAKSYPVVMRFSTTPGDLLPDSISTPRGLALKVVGVAGARLPGSESDVTQDFVMVNGPAFQTSDARMFLANLKLLAATTDRMEGAKVAASTVLQGTEKLIESLGGKSVAVRALGGEPATHPLGETYYTQTPLLYGAYMAKLSIVPVAPELTELTGRHVDISHNPTALRDAMTDHFAIYGGEWDIRAQLCTDLDAMPIEDAAKVWPEDISPYVTVARLTVEPQTSWNQARSEAVDDGMSFSPWHGLAAHRPLGQINRLRKEAYAASAHFRAARTGQALAEPRGLEDLGALRDTETSEVFYP